jgi:hypothetical protein
MEEEINEDEGSQEDEDSPPSKRIRTETMVLDEEENEIASGLRPIHETSRVPSQLEQDKTRSQYGNSGSGSEDEGGGGVDDHNGDGHTGFEDNGVCP